MPRHSTTHSYMYVIALLVNDAIAHVLFKEWSMCSLNHNGKYSPTIVPQSPYNIPNRSEMAVVRRNEDSTMDEVVVESTCSDAYNTATEPPLHKEETPDYPLTEPAPDTGIGKSMVSTVLYLVHTHLAFITTINWRISRMFYLQ